jgi:hypothetical protein
MTSEMNLITDITNCLRDYKMDQVRFFPSIEVTSQDMAACYAMEAFFKSRGVDAGVYVTPGSRDHIKKEFLDCNAVVEENKFVSVVIGAKDLSLIESEAARLSYILFCICAPYKGKGFGVRNYINKTDCCSGELIAQEFKDYLETPEHRGETLPQRTLDMLYISLLGGTKKYERKVKEHVFEIAGWLIAMGADYKMSNSIYNNKPLAILECEKIIYSQAQTEDNIAWAVIPQSEDLPVYSIDDYTRALDAFRDIEGIDCWALMIDRGYSFYDVILQSRENCPYCVNKVAIKNNGKGDEHDAVSVIRDFDCDKIVSDLKLLVKITDERGGDVSEVFPDASEDTDEDTGEETEDDEPEETEGD